MSNMLVGSNWEGVGAAIIAALDHSLVEKGKEKQSRNAF